MTDKLVLSALGHTWILDFDGTIVKHNGYKIDGCDTLLNGAKEFLKNIPYKDMIIFVTSREEKYREITENFLAEHNIRYNHIIFNAPFGERILVNDCKPSGLKTAVAINTNRDEPNNLTIEISEDL
jgi:hypothetical protein